MTSSVSFGESVVAEAQRLKETGLDANQIAAALCKKDPEGKNYGIGILVGGDGKPMATSPTMLETLEREIKESTKGVYLNSAALQKDLTREILTWQGVPESLWPHFKLSLPSDAGTGAVQTAVQAATLLDEGLTTLAVEELGWPAYKPIAASSRLTLKEFPTDGAAGGPGILPLYQAGPMNTTGKVPSADVVKARVESAKAARTPIVLDRAYSGFEFARRLGSGSMTYADLMKESFKNQVEPFTKAGIPFCMAVSPTKAFVTFALRPCGILLVFNPDPAKDAVITPKLTGLIRARGSSFEHVVTRAFVKALLNDRAKLEAEHAGALQRLADAEVLWAKLAKGTIIEPLFTEAYAGLFRNPKAKPDAAKDIYGAHVYPVFAAGRCRLNVTGLPADEEQAAGHVAIFARNLIG